MEEDFSNVIGKFQDIMKEKNIDLNSILNSSNNTSSNTENTDKSTSDFNLDINTILKMKQIFDRMNNNSNPRNNLLLSLKPFLREEKREKLEQYIKISNLLSVLEIMNNEN